MNGASIDTLHSIETPEGVILDMHPAGPMARIGAWLLDALIRFFLYIALSIVLGVLGASGVGIFLILFFLLEWFYPVYFELISGATPGKKALNLIVVSSNGTPISWQASVIRNLLRVVDFLPFFYVFGQISMMLSDNFQRMGDLAAGSLVIYNDMPKDYSGLPDAPGISPPLVLEPEQQQSILSYAERLDRLSDSRAIELAEHLKPLHQTTGVDAVKALLSYAQWLAKGQHHQ